MNILDKLKQDAKSTQSKQETEYFQFLSSVDLDNPSEAEADTLKGYLDSYADASKIEDDYKAIQSVKHMRRECHKYQDATEETKATEEAMKGAAYQAREAMSIFNNVKAEKQHVSSVATQRKRSLDKWQAYEEENPSKAAIISKLIDKEKRSIGAKFKVNSSKRRATIQENYKKNRKAMESDLYRDDFSFSFFRLKESEGTDDAN